jgi:long-chain-acyl-CoA dehydrogenase
MERCLYTADHEAFREVVAKFLAREAVPNLARWEEQRLIDRSAWVAAGRQGIIGLLAPAEYGGAGQTDFRFRNVIYEEFAKVGASSLSAGFANQDDIVMPYIAAVGTEEQKARWLPGMCAGEMIGAIAMTEPGTGSDLRGIRTSARKVEDGWVLNGAKTFITSGILSDVVIVVARTKQSRSSDALSLLVVERGMPGFSRGRQLDKLGLHAQDTAELAFDDVHVPDGNLLGDEGGGLRQLVTLLPLERLTIAASALAVADVVLASTLEYTQQRQAFGKPIADFQNTRFELAELATELDVARSYVDKAILAHGDGTLTAVDAAKAKWWVTDMQNRLIDRCLQLFGGYGYMREYPVARAFLDARVQKIFGGTNEIMKELIGRDMVGRR